MIIIPKTRSMEDNRAKLFSNKNKLLLSYESYIYAPEEGRKLFKIQDEKKQIIIARLAYLDSISRNRCFYPIEDVLWSLKNSKYIQECISQGKWFGEYEHPSRGCTLNRFMQIDDERISHRILKYWMEGNFIMGLVQFVPPKGDLIWDYIMKGINMAFSLRIYTPSYQKCKDAEGVEYIKKIKPMYPVSFDTVKVPGYEMCCLADPGTFAAQNQYWLTNGKPEMVQNGTESFQNISQSWFVNNPLQEKETIENTISSEGLLTDLSDCFKTNFIVKNKKIIKPPIPLYDNTQRFHNIMKEYN